MLAYRKDEEEEEFDISERFHQNIKIARHTQNTERYKDKGKNFLKKSLLSEFLAVESKLGSSRMYPSARPLCQVSRDGSEQSSALEHL